MVTMTLLNFQLKVKLLGGFEPAWNDDNDGALDLQSAEDRMIRPGDIDTVPLGFATAFPRTYVGIIKERSGLALRGLEVHGGVIDSNYRGEWKVIIRNNTNFTYDIARGDRIAQAIFVTTFHLIVETVDNLPDSSRGALGFGSSGK
jgi:dUTP pyrophosphatase